MQISKNTHKNFPSMVLCHTEMLYHYILLHLRNTDFNTVLHCQILPVNLTHYLLLDLSTAGLHHYLLSTSCRCGGVLLHVCCLTSVGWAMRWNLSLKNSNNMLLHKSDLLCNSTCIWWKKLKRWCLTELLDYNIHHFSIESAHYYVNHFFNLTSAKKKKKLLNEFPVLLPLHIYCLNY